MVIKNKIIPAPLSLITHHLHMVFKKTGIVLASGTGFIYCKNKKYYLITNWHNVTGKNPITKKHLDEENLSQPDAILTYFRDKDNSGSASQEILNLYNDENMTEPLWLEHPDHKEKVDVVAIPILSTFVEKYSLFPINSIDFDDSFVPEVADEVFIIGYPFSELQYLQLPIWKKGSIASEPSVNIDQLPKLYIDTATRPGLSGSPVVYQRIGVHNLGKNGIPSDNTIFGKLLGFLGIYSGRIGKDEALAQLGIVWKKNVIDEIIKN